jgi:hypothetical protein
MFARRLVHLKMDAASPDPMVIRIATCLLIKPSVAATPGALLPHDHRVLLAVVAKFARQ